MKTKDIVVGEDYAYLRYKSKYGNADPVRVTVLETGVSEKRNCGYYTTTVHGLVRVRYANTGKIGTVPVRQIERTWAEQEILNKANNESRAKADVARRNEYARRALLADIVEDRLANAGWSLKDYGVFQDEALDALREWFPGSERGVMARFDAPRLVRDNVVSGDVLRAVLNG